MSLKSHYPFAKFRPYAEDALGDAEAAFDSGKRFVMINALTGAGKSAMAVAFARHFKTAILTPTKMLQDQYANTEEFTTEYTVFGKSNYRCGLKAFKHLTVDQAICCSNAATKEYANLTDWEQSLLSDRSPSQLLKAKCSVAGICEYYKLISSIPVKSSPVVNYDLFFHLKRTPLNPREGTEFGDSIVFDEAHHLMSKARSVFGYNLRAACGKIAREGRLQTRQ